MEFFRETQVVFQKVLHIYLKWDGIRGLDSEIRMLNQPFSSGTALGARLGSVLMDKDRMVLKAFPGPSHSRDLDE